MFLSQCFSFAVSRSDWSILLIWSLDALRIAWVFRLLLWYQNMGWNSSYTLIYLRLRISVPLADSRRDQMSCWRMLQIPPIYGLCIQYNYAILLPTPFSALTTSQSWSSALQYLWKLLANPLYGGQRSVCGVLVLGRWLYAFKIHLCADSKLDTVQSILGHYLPLILVWVASSAPQCRPIVRSSYSAWGYLNNPGTRYATKFIYNLWHNQILATWYKILEYFISNAEMVRQVSVEFKVFSEFMHNATVIVFLWSGMRDDVHWV